MPRLGTPVSLANQSSAARTFDLWFARVFGVDPTRAWWRRPIAKRADVQRAGIIGIGLSIDLAIWRSEQSQCDRVRSGRSCAFSIAATTSAKDASSRAGVAVVVIGTQSKVSLG